MADLGQFQTRHRLEIGRTFSVLLMVNLGGHNTRKLFFVLSIAIGLSILPANMGFAMGSKNGLDGKGLYFYSGKDISRFLGKIGYPNFSIKTSWDILRNSDGTALRFLNRPQKKLVVVLSTGSIKEIDLPSSYVWLNDDNYAIAWLDKGRIYYKTGMSEYPPFKASFGADFSGKYFMKTMSSTVNKDVSIGTAIFSIEMPMTPLAKIMKFQGERIFLKDDKLLLFGSSYGDRDKQIYLHTFRREGHRLIKTEEVIIRRPRTSMAPFNVDDYSPWTEEVLLCDVHDFPSRSEWYVFNLKTHEMRRIGKEPFGGGWGFYLQCDIIKEATKKLKVETE